MSPNILPNRPRPTATSILYGLLPRPSNASIAPQKEIQPPPLVSQDKGGLPLRLLLSSTQTLFEKFSAQQDAVNAQLTSTKNDMVAMKSLLDEKDDRLSNHVVDVVNRSQNQILNTLTQLIQESILKTLGTPAQASAVHTINERLAPLQNQFQQIHFVQEQQAHMIRDQQDQLKQLHLAQERYVQLVYEQQKTIQELKSPHPISDGALRSFVEDGRAMVNEVLRDAVTTCLADAMESRVKPILDEALSAFKENISATSAVTDPVSAVQHSMPITLPPSLLDDIQNRVEAALIATLPPRDKCVKTNMASLTRLNSRKSMLPSGMVSSSPVKRGHPSTSAFYTTPTKQPPSSNSISPYKFATRSELSFPADHPSKRRRIDTDTIPSPHIFSNFNSLGRDCSPRLNSLHTPLTHPARGGHNSLSHGRHRTSSIHPMNITPVGRLPLRQLSIQRQPTPTFASLRASSSLYAEGTKTDSSTSLSDELTLEPPNIFSDTTLAAEDNPQRSDVATSMSGVPDAPPGSSNRVSSADVFRSLTAINNLPTNDTRAVYQRSPSDTAIRSQYTSSHDDDDGPLPDSPSSKLLPPIASLHPQNTSSSPPTGTETGAPTRSIPGAPHRRNIHTAMSSEPASLQTLSISASITHGGHAGAHHLFNHQRKPKGVKRTIELPPQDDGD